MKILPSSWSELSPQTIINCLRRAGISDSSQQLAQCDADGSFKRQELELHHLEDLEATAIQDDLNFKTKFSVSQTLDISNLLLSPLEYRDIKNQMYVNAKRSNREFLQFLLLLVCTKLRYCIRQAWCSMKVSSILQLFISISI